MCAYYVCAVHIAYVETLSYTLSVKDKADLPLVIKDDMQYLPYPLCAFVIQFHIFVYLSTVLSLSVCLLLSCKCLGKRWQFRRCLAV